MEENEFFGNQSFDFSLYDKAQKISNLEIKLLQNKISIYDLFEKSDKIYNLNKKNPDYFLIRYYNSLLEQYEKIFK